MFSNNYTSSLVSGQLPEFVRQDHPNFVVLLEKYYEYMEQTDKATYVGKRLYDYMDVDSTRADLLQYFKNKIIPSFPEETQLSKQKLIKAARDFYDKKGTPDGFKFLFRVLYGQEIDVYFPKEDILRASDGKWKLPQALRISVADTSTLVNGGNVNVAITTANVIAANGLNFINANIVANSYIRIGTEKRKVISVGASSMTVDIPFAYVDGTQIYDTADLYKLTLSEYDNFDFNLLERRKGIGSVSKASCIIESAVRSVDKNSGREIVELYVSNIKKGFETNENIEITYIDPVSNATLSFSSKIISLISNINLYRNRFGIVQSGSRYKVGDPVVFYDGLSNSDEAIKAVANVKSISVGTLDSVTLTSPGYYFRSYANSIVRIEDATGIGANLLIGAVSSHASNSAAFKFNTDSIYYKKNITLNAVDYAFDNLALANANSQIGLALAYDTYTLGEITFLNLANRGSFFEAVPAFDPVSVYDTDYSTDVGFVSIAVNSVSNYNKTLKTIQLPAGFSSVNGFYIGARLFIDVGATAHYSLIIDYDGATKTAYLDKAFENNITNLNAANFSYFLDFRGDVRSTGKLGAIEILNGGTNYTSGDKIEFIGTGYDAAASLTVTAGVITGVTLSNRGEGYVERPTCRVVSSTGGVSTGSGAVFVAYTLSDGEQIDATTSGIGEIQSFNLIDRGYDYVSTPVVSLKVADILTDDLPSTALIVSGDVVWQGGATNENATFTAIVDDIYRPDNTRAIIRLFDYNGTFDATSQLKINTATENVSTTPLTATGSYSFKDVHLATSRDYPYFYGNGLAKANAVFASGLIKYEGYYLNTDGHISADKKLQNKDYYHNFSYEIQSEKALDDYKKTIYDVAHPAGMQLLSKYVMNDVIDVGVSATSQTSLTIVPTGEGTPLLNASPVILNDSPEFEFLLHMDGAAGSATFVDATVNNYVVDSYYFGANTITQSSTVQKSGYGNTTKFPYVYLISFGSYAGGYLKVDTDSSGLSLNDGTDWTIEGWFYTTDSQNRSQCIFYYGNDDASGNYLTMSLTGTTTKTVAMTGLFTASSVTTNYALNTWYHFAVVRDSATSRFRLYVDGKFERESSVVVSGFPSTANLRIGADSSAGVSSINQNDCFTGYMDEISLRMASNYYTANTTAGTSPYTIPTSPLVSQYYTYNLTSNVAVRGDNNADFTDADVGDLLLIDAGANRNFVKQISAISSSSLLYTESSIAFIGDGKLRTTSACNQVIVSGNTSAISSTVQADDFIEFKILPKTFYANSVNITSATVMANTLRLSASDAGFDELTVGEVVTVNNEIRVVSAIANANAFVVTQNFTYNGTDKQITQGSSLIRKVSGVSGNVITLDIVSPSTNTNVVYKVYPYHDWVSYQIIKPL